MERKHTPGPWVAEEYQGRTTRLRVRTADQAATICQVTALIHKQANARLIAAAPTLKAALEDLMRASADYAVISSAVKAAWLNAEAAIRKATVDELSQGCHATRDGDCYSLNCPQLRDGEPKKSGRHCPLDRARPDAPQQGEGHE